MPAPSHAAPFRETVAIVGNAPDLGDRGAEIDACRTVVRFNNTAGLGGAAGRRVTHLALVNRGGQPREWLDEGFSGMRALRQAPDVILPFPRLSEGPSDLCWTAQMQRALAPFGVRTRTLGDDLHLRARAALRSLGATGRIDPSTGFLVAFDLLQRGGAERTAEVFGFGFAGWDGHPWEAERRWFERCHERGLLVLHPLAKAA